MRFILRLANFLVAFLLTSTLIFATNHYVDKNAAGLNNGTNWTNAWQSFSAINWNSIQPGDVIYISGGTDSTIYNEQLNINTHGSANNYVTVQNGIDSGHNGRVIINGGFTRNYGVYIEQGCGSSQVGSWIYVKGLEIRRTKLHGIYLHCSVNNIVIDGCKVTEALGRSVMLIGNDDYYLNENGVCAKDIEIKNCYLESHPDESTTENDVVYLQMGARLNIHHNYIHQQNRQSLNQPPNHMHIDCIQMHVTRDVKIWNNVCVIDSGVYGHAMILGIQSRPGGLDTLIIYNNYLYEGGHLSTGGNPSVPELYLRWYGYVNSVEPPTFVYNNTIVGCNGGSYPIYHEFPAQVKNNIIAQFGTNGENPAIYGGVGFSTWFGGWNNSWYTDADSCTNNLIWRDYSDVVFGGNRFRGSGGYPVGSPLGWTGWVNTYGGTGINSNPLFVNNVRGKNGYVISSNSPALNAGYDLKNFIESKGLPWTDIDGNLRDSSPDLGAYQYSSGNEITFSLFVQVNNGWNLVSVPGINPSGMDVDTWWAYRDISASVYKYANGFQPVTLTTPGTGYWMKHSGVRSYNTGEEWPASGILKVEHEPISGESGWNLIGGYEMIVNTGNITTNPPGLLGGPVYKYTGGYRVATILNPGYGYWIKLTGPGQIIISETLVMNEDQNEWFPENWGRIIFTDASGLTYTLYAVSEVMDLSPYELPPPPLDGMFDIRFSSGRIAEYLGNAEKSILMNGINYPVRIIVKNLNINLQDETGKELNVSLSNGEEVIINDKSIGCLKVVSGQVLNPEEYSLEQNYPNPFNTSTEIKFSLPETTNASLIIYNVLGEKVAEILNEKLDAGNHNYRWNASDAASGLYIYELRTDNFISVKKMLLMK